VVGSVVPDDMNDALIGVTLLDLGQKLCCTNPINGYGLDKGCIEGFEVYSPMNVLKWSYFFGQVCGLAKMHQVGFHAAFSASVWPKYAVSGVRLSRAV
jgi:hypothetical protein